MCFHFNMFQSPETGDFLTESQISVMMGDECGSLYERRQPDFAVEKTSVPQIGANSGEEFSHFLEDGIHPTQRHLLDHHDSFVNHNMINLLSRDQPGRRATFNQCGYDCLSDAHVMSSDESQSTSGFIPGNFTVPRAASPNRPFSASYIETCQPNRPCQKQHTNNERNELRRSLEKDCYPVSCGRRGWCCTLSFSPYKYTLLFRGFKHTHSWLSVPTYSISDSASYVE